LDDLTRDISDVGESDQPIPLPNVSSSVLKKASPLLARVLSLLYLYKCVPQVLEYCEHHRGERLPTTDAESQDETRKRTTDISEWDQKFIAVDQEMLFEIILAANYLDIKPLLLVPLSGYSLILLTSSTATWAARLSPT
jgi:S-phase kinase-associated protein 1